MTMVNFFQPENEKITPEARHYYKDSEILRTVFDLVSDGIAVAGPDGRVLDVNDGLLKLLGYSEKYDMLGKHLADFIVPFELLGESETASGMVQGRDPEQTIIKSDGSQFTSEVFYRTLTGPAREPAGSVTIIKNLEYQLAQEDVIIAERSFRQSLDNSPIGVCIVTGEDDLRYANQAILDIFGYDSVEELEITPLSERFTPESYAEHLERTKNRKLGREVPHNYEVSIIRKDGKIRHLMAFRKVIIWNGEIDYQVSFHDITENREAEKLYRAMAGNSPIGVYIVQDNKFVYVNPKFCSITGFTETDLLGMSPLDLVLPEDRQTVRGNAVKMLKNELYEPYEFKVVNKNGETRWTLESVSSVYYKGKRATLGNFMDITLRKNATQELSYSDAALRSIHEGIFVLDNEFSILRWNSICEQMFGFMAEDIIGKPFWTVIEPEEEYPGQNLEKLNLLINKGYGRAEQVYHLDTGDIWVDSFAQAIESDGQRRGWIFILSDISERKRIEKDLRESEKNIRLLLNSMEDLVFTYDLDGRFTSAFRPLQKHDIRKQADEFIGKKYSVVLPENICQELDSAIAGILRTGENQQFDYSLDMKDGLLWYNAKVSPITDVSGEITGILSVSRNITDRKRMEEIIERAARDWEVTFNSITDSIAIIGKDFRIQKANKAYAENNGYNYQELVGNLCHEVVRKRNGPCPGCSLVEVTRTGKPVLKDFTASSTGRYWQSVTSPLLDDNGEITAFVSTARDITDKKKMEEQLQQSQLLASLGTMTAGIAHEVNNPLGSVLLLSELLLRENPPGNMKKDLKIIHSEAKRAAKIMSTLLMYRKNQAVYYRRLNLNKIIRKVLEIRQYRHKVRNIGIRISLPDTPLYVRGDSSQLTQVFMNIFLNAEEALKGHRSGIIIVHASSDDNWVRVSIADNGEGIPEKNLDQVFHPFFTTKKTGEGTGLGLSTCYSIVTSHNGLIRAENNEMGGATFTIEFPRLKNRAGN